VPWPEDDSFDAGATAYESTRLSAYVRLIPWTTDPVFGSGGTGYGLGSSAWTSAGELYSGWWPNPSSPGSIGAVPTAGGGTSGASEATGWAFRDFYEDDVRVSASFKFLGPDVPEAHELLLWAVGARLSGGTLTSSGTDASHLLSGSGYWVAWLGDPSASGVPRHQLELLRLNSGTVTRLATLYASDQAWSTFNAGNPHVIQLEVSGTGATVTITGRFSIGGSSSDPGALTTAFVHLDTSGSRITAAGRCGFASRNEFLEASEQRATGVAWFEIVAGGVVVLREDWQRFAPTSCATIVGAFAAPRSGFDLASSWQGDARGASTWVDRMLADVANGRVQWDSSSTVRTGFYLSQRRASDPSRQDRQVSVLFPAGAAGVGGLVRGLGVVVRATAIEPAGSPSACYVAELQYDQDATTARVKLRRISTSGEVDLARKDSGVSLTLGTARTLRLFVENSGIPDPSSGNVKLRVYLDGVQVQLVAPTTAAAGVLIDSDGTVTDASSERVLAGNGEGLYVRSKVGALVHVVADAWGHGAGSGPSDPEDDAPSITVSHEADGAVETLEVPVDWPIREVSDWLSVDHELGLDYRYVATSQDRPRRQWLVGQQGATIAEVESLRAFFELVGPADAPFFWVPPDETSAVVVYRVEDSLVDELVDRGVDEVHSFSFKLQELLPE
jgi:hypothetical protein